MNKKVFKILLFAFLPFVIFSQTKNYKVSYRFSFRNDTTKYVKEKAKYQQEKFSLINNGTKLSYFIPENTIYNDSIKQIKEKEYGSPLLTQEGVQEYYDFISQHKLKSRRTISDVILIKDSKEITNQFFFKGGVGKFVKCTENYPLQFEVTSDTATILGIACNTATTEYAGRKYKLWYAPSIPIYNGPFVFTGLPGLILKAVDVDSIYFFIFENLEISNSEYSTPDIEGLNNFKDISKAEFIKILQAKKTNPEEDDYDPSAENIHLRKKQYFSRTDLIMMRH